MNLNIRLLKYEKKYAVVTDATSDKFIFQNWHKYYSQLFDSENIYIYAYTNNSKSFNEYKDSNIIYHNGSFNDDTRLLLIETLIEDLLTKYETIIRVDTDEFLLPEASSSNLKEYLNGTSYDYITAKGFDLFEFVEDSPIDLTSKILKQRKYCFALTAMNKTCIVKEPLKWVRGFHYCNVTPMFNNIFLFHAKRISIAMQNNWNKFMLENLCEIKNENDRIIYNYYAQSEETINSFHDLLSNRLRRDGFDNGFNSERLKIFEEDFLSKVTKRPSGIFDGPYDVANFIIKIPHEYENFF